MLCYSSYRTISEGNSHLETHLSGRGRGGWHRPNMISGSPLSPGSFVSSESAGSSNSVDSDTMPVGSFDNHKYGEIEWNKCIFFVLLFPELIYYTGVTLSVLPILKTTRLSVL